MRVLPALAVLIALAANAAEIVPPSASMERSGPLPFVYRTNSLATGKGELSIRWTDSYGRVIEDRKIPVELNDENEISFTLDLRRAVAMRNEVIAQFKFDGQNKRNQPDHREETAKVEFIASPPDREWWDYQILMWQRHSAEQ